MANVTIEQIQDQIMRYWERIINDPDVEIAPDSNMIDDLALSSLEILVSLMEMEDNYGVRIPERCLRGMTTPRGAAQVIFDILCEGGEANEEQG